MVAIALLVYALIDCLQTDSTRFRSLNRVAWAAIIVLIPLIGPILWLAVGKVRHRPQRPAAPPPRRPLAPDDDPEFLRHLRDVDDKHEQMLNQWEADLRRRETEIQRKKDAEARAAEEAQRRKEAEARQREDEARQHTDDEDDSR
ncbi:PLD nuclease N-terminal domain-containing protein [Jiangella aurantiaca]|uniref:PLD nuclease N-terminal domain-containing protein n=1 Tax=Jiangella aurantiaca TaxID=2530373 RepID=UPI00193EBACA|nr:PLD nuclease N-terminal domain-containing protein [Jiangella aurantiaca]